MNKTKNKTLAKATGLLRSRESSLLLVMILLVAVIQWRSGGMFLSGTVMGMGSILPLLSVVRMAMASPSGVVTMIATSLSGICALLV